eukprot:6208565-Pleurochrysis_carterae.AAC.1
MHAPVRPAIGATACCEADVRGCDGFACCGGWIEGVHWPYVVALVQPAEPLSPHTGLGSSPPSSFSNTTQIATCLFVNGLHVFLGTIPGMLN